MSLKSFYMTQDLIDASSSMKIMGTTNYSMQKNPNQDFHEVHERCKVATMAEQSVAYHMNGSIMDNPADYSDPYSYSFDVLSGKEYYGARIEVKTHQSDSKWINVNIDHHNKSGVMNLFHFLEYDVADFIAIYRSKKINGIYSFSQAFVGNRSQLKPLITKSNYGGWYLKL